MCKRNVALGVNFGAGHRLYAGARRAVEWDEDEDYIKITFEVEPVNMDAVKKARWVSKALPGLSVTRMDTVNTVMVELNGVFSISANAMPITDKDNRIHMYGQDGGRQPGAPGPGLPVPQPHQGRRCVLGQTYGKVRVFSMA
ncbi:hypothetical protein C2845_PM12G02650 [Panicum miliaceum]|uniref:Uncharacterized protein n=1 Tax=Panicum miliaceum TaxID=4540 RepID=A0A3L6QKE7_PANMI|nr:hypothetical protein C2845_PM12G02650 [Panicum miliaceum]